MAGAFKNYVGGGIGKIFPNSRYNDPLGGRASSLERNIFRVRSVEMVLYLYYAQEVRDFMLELIYPLFEKISKPKSYALSSENRLEKLLQNLIREAQFEGKIREDDAETLLNQFSYDRKAGKKLSQAFAYAVKQDMFDQEEADELQQLLRYRNDLAHRVDYVMADVTRVQSTIEILKIRGSAYEGDALDRLKKYYFSLTERARNIPYLLHYSWVSFEFAEKVYKEELRRLEKVIIKQIAKQNQSQKQLEKECDLTGTGLKDRLDPRHPLNFYQNGHDTILGI